MRRFFSYILFVGLFMVYSFFTLPLLLPIPQSEKLADSRYDAIIVLGGGLTSNCALDASLQARMDKAIELYRNSYTLRIILTGGLQLNSNCFESESMRAYALQQNVPAEILIKENKALNTYQNAQYTTALMRKRGMKSALIVTSDFHLKRANLIFDKYNIDYQMVSSPSFSEGKRKYMELFKEQLLLCFHAVFGVPERFGLDLKAQNLSEVLKSIALN